MNTPFNSKETYLRWTSEWKAQYRELTNDIREAKYARWYNNWSRQEHTLKLLSEAQDARFNAISKKLTGPQGYFMPEWSLEQFRNKATLMLEQRKAAKIEAQRQYQAAHAAVVGV